MIPQEIQAVLESNELYAQAAIADDVKSFIRIALGLPVTSALKEYIRELPENVDTLAGYASGLLRQGLRGNGRFDNDVSLAVCLLVLSDTASPISERLIKSSAVTESGMFGWVPAVARHATKTKANSIDHWVSFPRHRHDAVVFLAGLRPEGNSSPSGPPLAEVLA